MGMTLLISNSTKYSWIRIWDSTNWGISKISRIQPAKICEIIFCCEMSHNANFDDFAKYRILTFSPNKPGEKNLIKKQAKFRFRAKLKISISLNPSSLLCNYKIYIYIICWKIVGKYIYFYDNVFTGRNSVRTTFRRTYFCFEVLNSRPW